MSANIGNCNANIFDTCCDCESGGSTGPEGPTGPTGPAGVGTSAPMTSSRINTPLSVTQQVLSPSDPNPSYINFSNITQGIYDYDNNNSNYSLTSQDTITINVSGYYNVGILMNTVTNVGLGHAIFQVTNLLHGPMGSIPPTCTLLVPMIGSLFPTSFSFVGSSSSSSNCYLQAGSTLKVAYVTSVLCDITPTSSISITLLDGAMGPTGPTGPSPPTSPFLGQGWSVQLLVNPVVISTIPALVTFDGIEPLNGGFNTLGWFDTTIGIGTINETGTYSVTTTVNYEHNFNLVLEVVQVYVQINGVVGRNVGRTFSPYYPTYNDEQSIIVSNIVELTAGDYLEVYIEVPSIDSNQNVLLTSSFACQRIA